jgi:hypothetical protein
MSFLKRKDIANCIPSMIIYIFFCKHMGGISKAISYVIKSIKSAKKNKNVLLIIYMYFYFEFLEFPYTKMNHF